MRAADPGEILLKMSRRKFLLTTLAALFALGIAGAGHASAQKQPKQEPTTGGISGRVRVETGTPDRVSVTLRRGDEEVAQTTTNAKGDFQLQGIAPGSYGLTLRKQGLQVGRRENVEVRAGKTASLKGTLYLPVDEGAIAFIRGSVFNAAGRSFHGVRVELARVEADGTVRKLDSRVSNPTGSFGFRLPPERARYRLTAKADGMEPATKDVEIEGAAIYRVALSLEPARK